MVDPALKVIYEDNHIIAINKPSGWIVHEDHTKDESALDKVKEYIKLKYDKPGDVFLNLVHRLDRPVSGVLLFARTSKALTRLNETIKAREISKIYLAAVANKPNPLEGKLINYISKNRSTNISSVTKETKGDAKYCELDYKLNAAHANKYILKINLKTGRPHQIRVQLSYKGMPIIGDLKYGFPTALTDQSIALHCSEMSFIHPVKKELIRITANLPKTEFWNSLKQ